MPRDFRALTVTTLITIQASIAMGAAWAQTQQKSGLSPSAAPAPPPVAAPAAPPAQTGSKSAATSSSRPASSGGPEFRDPKTGQIWTPDNVGQGKEPTTPEDRAFDPTRQAVTSSGIVDQTPVVQRVGTVPITAGPTVPLVELDNLSMRVVPGDHWQLTVFLRNNSAITYAPVFVCHFDNGGNVVQTTRVSVPPTAGGERLRLTITGPRSDLFVNNSGCRLTSP